MGGKTFSQDDIGRYIGRAEELGFNFVDTGECYRNHASERLIGGALQGKRERFVVATKFGHIGNIEDRVADWSFASIMASLDASLAALRTDYIDIFQAHLFDSRDSADFLENRNGICRALAAARAAGKIRAAGISLGDNELIEGAVEILKLAIEVFGVETAQVAYSRLHNEAEESVIPLARVSNLGLIARAPLAKGYLSTRFKPAKDYDAELLQRARGIIRAEVPAGVDSAEWAIAWCVRDPAIGVVVPGCSAIEQLDSTVRAAEVVRFL